MKIGVMGRVLWLIKPFVSSAIRSRYVPLKMDHVCKSGVYGNKVVSRVVIGPKTDYGSIGELPVASHFEISV
jgi:hypothetical protein